MTTVLSLSAAVKNNAGTGNTVFSGTYYLYASLAQVQVGYYAYSGSTGEKVGTVSANDGTSSITITSLVKNTLSPTNGGFVAGTNQFYFFAAANITITPISYNTGTSGTNVGVFNTGTSADPTTGATLTTPNISNVQVGWRCYEVNSSASHIGTVTAINSSTKTITIDYANFVTNSNYFFADPTNITLFRPVAGGSSASASGSSCGFGFRIINSNDYPFDYIQPGFKCYYYTNNTSMYNLVYVGLVKYNGYSGTTQLLTGAFDSSNAAYRYVFVHPNYNISGSSKAASVSGATYTFTSTMFTTSVGFTTVTAGWEMWYFTSFIAKYRGLVTSNNYPTTNTITTNNTTSSTETALFVYQTSSVPNAPSSLAATPGSGQITVSFIPGSNGGSNITNYQYSINGGSSFTAFSSPTYTTSPVIITGLTNGTSYTIQLKAVNSVGVSVASSSVTSTPVSATTTPGAPTALVATAGDSQVSLAFSAPSNNGGATITNYSYSTNNGSTYTNVSPAQTTSPIVISGLTNGTTYTILLKAINSVGAGTASSSVTSTPVSATTTPGAPTALVATAGDSQVSLAFSAPASNGGATITNYSYSTDGGITYTTVSPAQTTSPIVITGLTNGTTYTILLKAINSVGAGTASSSITSTPVSATTAPGAPTLNTITIGDSSLNITFTAPSNTGGSAITNYAYSIDNGSTYTAFTPSQTSSPVSITNLTNGTAYTVRLKAINVMGYGTASNSITATPAGVPGAPSALVATIIDNTSVQIAFTPGAENGANVTNYFYSIDGGVSYSTFSPAQTVAPLTISGLTLGNSYSITIKEIDAGGVSPAATAIPVVFTAPDAPSALHATTEPSQTTVAFVSPSPGGALISNYEYSLDNGATFTAFSPAQTSSPVTITGLSDTATYNIQFKAVNIIGKSPASSTVSIIPATPPVETVSFSANESSVIVLPTTVEVEGVVVDVVKYWYSIDFGVTWIDPSNIVSIANLTNGVSYTIWYYAETAVGFGPTYVTSVIPAPSTPSAPTITTITPNTAGTELSIYFTAPVSNGGFAITDYQYTIDNGTTILTAGQTTSPIIVSGTIRNQVYPTAIAAVNSVGVGESSTIVVIKTFLPCFGKGTWIQCQDGYKRIENLVAGDKVITLKHGLVPIHTIGSRTIANSRAPGRTPDHMYICSADAYPEVFEDLVLTGYHALLVPSIDMELKEKVKVLYNGMLYMTDGMVRVPVCADVRAILHPDTTESFTIYNFALESNDIYMNYGVYANGLLVETSSIRFMTDLADMVSSNSKMNFDVSNDVLHTNSNDDEDSTV